MRRSRERDMTAEIDGAVNLIAPATAQKPPPPLQIALTPLSDAPPHRRVVDVRTEIGDAHPPPWCMIAH